LPAVDQSKKFRFYDKLIEDLEESEMCDKLKIKEAKYYGRVCMKLFVSIFVLIGVSMNAHEITHRLHDCLEHDYALNKESIAAITQELLPLLEQEQYSPLLDEFIALSKKYMSKPRSKTTLDPLPEDDAVMAAPDYHYIIGENDRVRVLYAVSKHGDTEPSHRHYWKSILINLAPSIFEIEYADGGKDTDHDPIGVYELPADTQAASYKNVGDESSFLRFEIKD
jgi:hypothetical protein